MQSSTSGFLADPKVIDCAGPRRRKRQDMKRHKAKQTAQGKGSRSSMYLAAVAGAPVDESSRGSWR